ncbi:hypothetical protein GEMRC1_013724 [Eukaryota sp. GEM-RC1]
MWCLSKFKILLSLALFGLFVWMSALTSSYFLVSEPAVKFLSFTDHISQFPLEHFSNMKDFPNEHYVPTDFADLLSTSTQDDIYILSGPPGAGKTVALFQYLREESVIWLDARIPLWHNIDIFGYRIKTFSEDICFKVLSDALSTHNFTLVITNVQEASFDRSIFDLFVKFVIPVGERGKIKVFIK